MDTKKRVLFLLGLLAISLILSGKTSLAETYIPDDNSDLSQETKEFVAELNEKKFSLFEGKPQYEVILTSGHFLIEDESPDQMAHHAFINSDVQRNAKGNGIVVVFLQWEHDVRFMYGDKFISLLSPLNENYALKERISLLMSDQKYDEAVIETSNYVYDYVAKANREKGLNYYYEKSYTLLQEERKEKERIKQKLLVVSFAIGILLLSAIMIYFRLQNKRLKKQFYSHNTLPSKLIRDELFNPKEFDYWLKANEKKYSCYRDKIAALRATEEYCYTIFFPRKIDQFKTFSEQQKKLLKRSLGNDTIGYYFFGLYFSQQQTTFLAFNKRVEQAQIIAQSYLNILLNSLEKRVAFYLSEEQLLEEKIAFLSEYEIELSKQARNILLNKNEKAIYLEKILLENKNLEALVATASDELDEVISSYLKTALLAIDLEKVYKVEPIYKIIIENDFSEEDSEQVMLAIRLSYKILETSITDLKKIVKAVIIEQQDVIYDRNKHQKTFVRFNWANRDVKKIFRPKSK